METKPKSKTTFFILVGMSTAILLATPVIILGGIGLFLDTIFHTGHFILIAGIVIGFVSGMLNINRLVKMMQKRKN